MILTCPSCATRYQADETKFPAAGRQVRCAKCGHVWHQSPPAPEPDSAAPLLVTPAPQAAAENPRAAESGYGAAFGNSGPYSGGSGDLGSAPMRPRMVVAPPPPRPPLLPLIGVVLGWIGLIAVVLLIGLSAVRYREDVIVIWPQSGDVYAHLGLKVNAHGIDFVHVDYHRESEDGQVVLAVKGAIINNGSRELPVPQTVRVTLSDASNHELYHWNFTPEAQSLKPGQSIPFLTRLSSPPAAARHLEVRFAKDSK